MPNTFELYGIPVLQLHLEPREPIEVGELTNALNAVASQYENFTRAKGLERAGDAKLLVSSVSPGSIDINFVLEVAAVVATFAPVIDAADVLTRFAEHVRNLLDYFGGEKAGPETTSVSVRDCNDAINMVAPIANHGGNQTFNIINGPVVLNVGRTDQREARKITESAARKKAELQFPNSEC